MTICVLKHFSEIVEDSDILTLTKRALDQMSNGLEQLKDIYKKEGHVLPVGFTDEDVHPGAPRLYTDGFILHYLRHMTRFSLKATSLALVMSTRKDILEFFENMLLGFTSLHKDSTLLLAEKGLLVKPPICPLPKEVDFVDSNSFMGTWFGKQRSLLMQEVAHIFGNIQTNALGKALLLSFSQTAHDVELRKFFMRGVTIAEKHIDVLSDLLTADKIPTPMTWDSDITESTLAPFSDKLMLFHASFINNVGVGDYGDAIAATVRGDVIMDYTRLIGETMKYSEDGVNLLIKNGWFEQAPKTTDRRELAGV